MDFQIVVVYCQLVVEQGGVWMMVDGYEEVVGVDVVGVVVQGGFYVYVGYVGIVVQYFFYLVVLDGFDFVFGDFFEQFVLYDFFCFQGVVVVDQVDFVGDVGQVQCFFYGGVVVIDYDYVLVVVEEVVIGGVGGDVVVFEGFFGWDVQVFGGGVSGDDQCVVGVFVIVVDQFEWVL